MPSSSPAPRPPRRSEYRVNQVFLKELPGQSTTPTRTRRRTDDRSSSPDNSSKPSARPRTGRQRAGRRSGAGCCRDSALDVFTEVRFPARDWALLVQSSERLEDRDLVLAAGLTCRTSNGCIEVVAGPQTERQLFCTLLADLLSQLPLSSTVPPRRWRGA